MYRGKYKMDFNFSVFYDFQSHHHLRLLLLHVNNIQLQRRSNNFHENEKGFGITTRTNASKNNYKVYITERYSVSLKPLKMPHHFFLP